MMQRWQAPRTRCTGWLFSAALLTAATSPAWAQGAATPAAASSDVGIMAPSGTGFAFRNAIPTLFAIDIKDGKYVPAASLSNAVTGGKVGDAMSSGLTINSAKDRLDALYVSGGSSNYTLSNAQITLSGNGSDDMSGIGAGVLAANGSTVTLKNVHITTRGVISSATTATQNSTLKVYDSVLTAHGGMLPAGYVKKIGPGMMEPPAQLGISGTARATNTTNQSQSYFYNTTIVADGWGALSTDMANGHVYLEANHCTIKTLKSGYGTYADTGARVVINDSTMDVASYFGIIAGDGSMAFKGLAGSSRGIGVMIHDVMGSISEIGTVRFEGGSLNTAKAVVLVKSANADITFENAALLSKSGVLLQSVVNDDPNATKVSGRQVMGITALFKHMKAVGNIEHLDTERAMTVTLIASTLRGAINNASVSLDKDSKWTATGASKVTFSSDVMPTQLAAASGITITATPAKGSSLKGQYKLAGGGMLVVNGS